MKLIDLKDKLGLTTAQAEGKEKIGGSLDLRGTQITSLPDNLTVGGSLYLRGTQIKNQKKNVQKSNRYLMDLLSVGDYRLRQNLLGKMVNFAFLTAFSAKFYASSKTLSKSKSAQKFNMSLPMASTILTAIPLSKPKRI